MGRYLNPTNSAFSDVLNSRIYIDKTDLLRYTNSVMNTTSKYICNSRPRRFGKSITADMLSAYYSRGCDSRKMFESLRIGGDKTFEVHLNKYDVIHIDVQWFIDPKKRAENIVDRIQREVLKELWEVYEEILDAEDKMKCDLPDIMSVIAERTGSRFVVIIDEWDVLIRDEAMNRQVQDEYIEFLRRMFKGAEPTKFIALAYLTGILPIKRYRTQSALNNFTQFTMLNPTTFASYMGFTEEEVKKLCMQYGENFNEVKRWYDGYVLGDYHVYNPSAVVNIMLQGEYQSYWSQTGTFESIRPYINMDFDGLKTDIIEMISGAFVEVNVTTFQNDMVTFESKDDVITFLIHLGYLTYHPESRTAGIPNEEIRQEFINATNDSKWTELMRFENESMELLNATLDMDEKSVAEYIERIHQDYASVIKYNDENSLSSVLTIAYLGAIKYYFKPIRELPTGRGFADFVFVPKKEYASDYPALIVELKWNKSAYTALQQIKDRNYPHSLTEYSGNIILVGINYDKKTKVHQCMIEKYQKN